MSTSRQAVECVDGTSSIPAKAPEPEIEHNDQVDKNMEFEINNAASEGDDTFGEQTQRIQRVEEHKLVIDHDNGSTNNAKRPNTHETRVQSLKRCINSVVHASQCLDVHCHQPSCQKMKRIVAHGRICNRRTNGGCPICKQLIALYCYHSRYCQEPKCPLPFCPKIKANLKQQRSTLKLQLEKVIFFISINKNNIKSYN